jgi:uncharacterized protein YyaL (SSP411 family)
MTHRVAAATIAFAFLSALGSAHENSLSPGRNHLAGEKGPYLQQHAANPIWWWTWSPEALAEARRQDKPIFLSIGYSTCHWCHVMERESFSQEDVAQVLNASFIAIKVDREERPDVDEIYMKAVLAMNGTGGWPLNALLTPEGHPYFGGTYFPHDKLLELVGRAAADWKKDRKKAEARGAELAQALRRDMQREASGNLSESLLARFVKAQEASFDWKNGGRLGRPKFPDASALRLLLRVHRRSGNPRALEMVTRTLDAMARGGIYDHVGGGFHRYTTDERWRVPHFEKTLYDQAVLVQAYLEAFQATGQPEYARIARESLDYVLRDLTSPDGAFFSAEDADSEGKEGTFYLWHEEELRKPLLPEELAAVRVAFGVTPKGDLPGGGNILHLTEGAQIAGNDVLTRALEKLRQVRAHRARPFRDEKVLADWNGMMVAAMARAGRILEEPRYAAGASRAARCVLSHLAGPDGTLLHRLSGGEARHAANLDDYVFLIDGLIELYEADFDRGWLDQAAALQRTVEQRFLAPAGNYYFTDGKDPALPLREIRTIDNVVPSGNSVAALNLRRLSDLLLDPELGRRAGAVLAATPRDVEQSPSAYAMLLMALAYASDRSKEVAIVGDPQNPATRALVSAVRAGFNPNLVLASGPPAADAVPLLRGKPLRGGEPTAYVCERQVCRAPTTQPGLAAELARAHRPLEQ